MLCGYSSRERGNVETHGLTSSTRGFPLGKGGGGLPWEMWAGIAFNLSHSLAWEMKDLQVLLPGYQ